MSIFSIFKSKNEDLKVDDSVAGITTSSGTTLTLPAGASAAGVTTTNGTIYVQGAVGNAVTISSPKPLSSEEEQELRSLKEVREAEDKVLKIAEFKSLPFQLRQHIVNFIEWHGVAEKISNLKTEKSSREQDLESRKIGYPYFNIATTVTTWDNYLSIPPPIPKGLTTEDIIKAHNDMCFEEQMIEQTDSKSE